MYEVSRRPRRRKGDRRIALYRLGQRRQCLKNIVRHCKKTIDVGSFQTDRFYEVAGGHNQNIFPLLELVQLC